MNSIVRFAAAWLAVAGAALLASCASSSQAPAQAASSTPARRAYTADERALDAASFEYIWETIRDKHFDPTLGGLDWQAVHDELKPSLAVAESRDDARKVMIDLVHRLGQSHLNVVPSSAYEAEEPATSRAGATSAATSDARAAAEADAPKPVKRDKSGEGSSGLDIRIVGNEAIVTDVLPASAADKAGVKPGWLIAAIDGSDIGARLRRMDQAFPESTSKAFYLAESVMESLAGRTGDTVAVEFVDAGSARLTRELTLAPVEGTPTQFGNLPTLYVYTRSRTLPENIQYFKFNMFFDPPKVIGALTQAVKDAQAMNARGFIIDLRGNPGGIGAMAMGVAGWFVQESEQKLGTMTTRNGTVNFVVYPRLRGFTGPVAVLVDGMSASTAEIFAAGMQDLRRARIFGTRTAGAALPSVFEVLPNNDRFQYVIANYVSVGGLAVEGNGVTPDEEVKLDRASLLSGRDPVVDAAVTWIKSSAGGTPVGMADRAPGSQHASEPGGPQR